LCRRAGASAVGGRAARLASRQRPQDRGPRRRGDLQWRPDRVGEGFMRIAVVGAGGVGGAYGAALAKAGADVTFIARGAHLTAMKSQGLRIEGGRGETHLVPTRATDDPKSVGPVDYVLFCVKLWDVESAGRHIKPLVGRDT